LRIIPKHFRWYENRRSIAETEPLQEGGSGGKVWNWTRYILH
jgi:hypothetical protein